MVEVLKNKITIDNFSFTPLANCDGYLYTDKTGLLRSPSPDSSEILLCRGSAQKIATYSGMSS